MVGEIVAVLRNNGGWMSIREIKDAIMCKYGTMPDYGSVYQLLNYTELANHVQRDATSKPQRYRLE